jgi:hypothetical protein
LLATGVVVTVNVAEVAPAATVTLAGTCATVVLLLDKVMTAPAPAAGPFKVTVPVDVVPPITEAAGFKVTEVSVAALIVRGAVLAVP